MAPFDGLVVFAVSLLLGALGIHVGALVITGTSNYERAVGTALVGAVVWAIVGFFLGGVPLVGSVLVLLAYLWVIKRRYPGGWLTAAGIALVAWIAALAVLALLGTLGVTGFSAFGVPGA
ncbi:MAG: hypothetical protein ABEJ31_15770 [Haloarculaceae archaeon]